MSTRTQSLSFFSESVSILTDNFCCASPQSLATKTTAAATTAATTRLSSSKASSSSSSSSLSSTSTTRSAPISPYMLDKMNPFGNGLVGDIKSIVDCAYKSLSGELYVTKRALCFRRTGLFGIETDRVIIPFEIVRNISEHKQNCLIIVTDKDNETESDSYQFSSVKDLDSLLQLLHGMWKEAKDAPDRVRKSAVDKVLRKITTLTPSQSDIDLSCSISGSLHEDDNGARGRIIVDLCSMEEKDEDMKKLMNFSMNAINEKEYSQKIAKNVSLDCTVDEFFNTFLADDAPYSLPSHHRTCGDTDVGNTNWVQTDTGEFQRRITYKHPINVPMAPPFGEAEKTQTMKRFLDHGLIVVTKAVVNDVPMTDCFYVEDCLLVSSNPEGGISLTTMYDLKFVKTTMFKKIITLTSINDLTKFHGDFVELIKKNISTRSDAGADKIEAEWREAINTTNEAYSQIIAKNASLDCTVDEFFNAFLADDAPYSLASYHKKCGDTDIRQTKWQPNESEEFQRRIAYNHPVNVPMGPPFGEADKTQVMRRFADHGLMIVSKTWINDVPMTDCFYVEDCLLVSSNPEGGISLSTMYDLKFVKNTMFKKIITLTSLKDLSRFHGGFLKLVNNRVGEIIPGAKTSKDAEDFVLPEADSVRSPELSLKSENRENFLQSIMSSVTSVTEVNPFVLIMFLTIVASQVYLISQLNAAHVKIALLETVLLNREPLECSEE